MAVAVLLAACGGDSSSGAKTSSGANEPAGSYSMRVTKAAFPAKQRLGQTTLMQIDVRNIGEKTVPALTVTVSIAGKKGENSPLPFGIRDPQPGLAQPYRPVWVLAQTYPRLAGSSDPAGASTSSPKTFSFGPLKPGQTTKAVWKLSAVRAGRYTVLYIVSAGLSAGGTSSGGTFATEISAALPDTEVTDSGEVLQKQQQRQRPEPGE